MSGIPCAHQSIIPAVASGEPTPYMRTPSLKTRKPAQKISLVSAYICYLLALVTLLAAGYQGMTIGTDNPIFASLGATIVFFVGAGVVLHVMGAVNLPDLRVQKDDD
ncbi:hemerythrin family protein [endosymbiont of Ridgeia piscesae]|uniref:Uncharacterized protein n=1 Tax=endosymbiont of Ridgeia piscesae TaxID=54398 RepID=A0A0T5YTM6_9GAMM|nr:hemerythrin family protein [endosymbiont of Ridgeia piscesae]KRT53912.1 hypothetical protein Ga0074115_10214 [endosymbiont of Ridgeia piscesae]KRT57705.1 hypothetical protein Ga0076813_12087 [endosymbiont of Ridgeia piscesae]